MQIKFLHAADLHLGSPFKGLHNVNPSLGKKLRKASFVAFDNMVDAAIEDEVDFVLIAGDSFDSGSGDLQAQFFFLRGMNTLREKGIPVYLITGNHDPLNKWSENLKMPDNVILFSGEKPEVYDFLKDGKVAAKIIGMSYSQREVFDNLAAYYPNGDPGILSIALLHGNRGTDTGHQPYSPFALDDLRRHANTDYWALGHIHKREVLSDQNPCAVFPGNIQGRHFNEDGEKGCYLVEFDGKKRNDFRFVPLSEFIFQRVEVDCSKVGDIGAFTEKLEEVASELLEGKSGTSFILRPVLIGMTEMFVALQNHQQVDELFREINNRSLHRASIVHFDSPVNKTLPSVNLEERAKSDDFFADLLRDFKALLSDDIETKGIIDEINEEITGNTKRMLSGEIEKVNKDNGEREELIRSARNVAVAALLEQKNRGNDN
ncbi:MAG: DNA repair exonuclease [Saprospirales bacterium]|nr:MAG: DNA repair exonuclease [Saprospirales bacterium]